MLKKIVLTFLIFLSSLMLFGENLRGLVSGISRLGEDDAPPVNLKLDEIAFFEINTDNPFLSGIEIRIEIPRELQEFRNSLALFLYRDVSPVPSMRQNDYSGSRVIMHILPTQNILSVKIPLNEIHNLIKDATSIVTAPLNQENFPLAVTLLPIMKGIPDRAYERSLKISLIPIYEDKGGLDFDITGEEELLQQMIFHLDGQEITEPEETLILPSGLHKLVITTPSTAPAEFSILIEAGKVYRLTHSLATEPANLVLPEIEGLKVWIDGVEMSETDLIMEPGEHLMRIELGDSLVLEEALFLDAGETIELRVNLSIQLEKKSDF